MAGLDKKRLEVIENTYPEEAEQVEAFATYYVKWYFNSAWHLLYGVLYSAGETAAMDKALQIDYDLEAFNHREGL